MRRSLGKVEGFESLKKETVEKGKAKKNSFKVYHYKPYPGGLFYNRLDTDSRENLS